jgi:hypothetical protein
VRPTLSSSFVPCTSSAVRHALCQSCASSLSIPAPPYQPRSSSVVQLQLRRRPHRLTAIHCRIGGRHYSSQHPFPLNPNFTTVITAGPNPPSDVTTSLLHYRLLFSRRERLQSDSANKSVSAFGPAAEDSATWTGLPPVTARATGPSRISVS